MLYITHDLLNCNDEADRREHVSPLRRSSLFAPPAAVGQRERMALPRKRRRRAPRRWSEGLADLHDYMQPQPQRRSQVRARAVESDSRIVVTDDWPEQVPISDAELRVIERHLRKELDALTGPLP